MSSGLSVRRAQRTGARRIRVEAGLEAFWARIEPGSWATKVFERYTERARRVIFFARYEASQLGSNSIETEHLLLGLIREGKGLTSRIFSKSHLSMETIRKEIE